VLLLCVGIGVTYVPLVVVTIVLALSVVISSATDPPRLLLPRLSPMIGPSGKPSDDDDNDDPAGKPCLPAVHHGIFVVLVVPTCLRHRRHRCRPPEMPLSKLV
jgi:hypothetical protein